MTVDRDSLRHRLGHITEQLEEKEGVELDKDQWR